MTLRTLPRTAVHAFWAILSLLLLLTGSGSARGPARPYLGVGVYLDESVCKVDDVTPDSPAAVAGLKPGDVIVKLARTQVKSNADLGRALLQRKVGEETVIEVLRGKKTLSKTVKLAKRPD